MKQLFRHTSSLLRTALLLGAAALFNVLPTQAMTEAELKEMLNAFETKTPTIDDGQYYYMTGGIGWETVYDINIDRLEPEDDHYDIEYTVYESIMGEEQAPFSCSAKRRSRSMVVLQILLIQE